MHVNLMHVWRLWSLLSTLCLSWLSGQQLQFCVLCYVTLCREGAVYNLATCFMRGCKGEEAESGQDNGCCVLESNLGRDIPSLLWNLVLQELITRSSPHSRGEFAHRQECQKVGRLIRTHCRVGGCVGLWGSSQSSRSYVTVKGHKASQQRKGKGRDKGQWKPHRLPWVLPWWSHTGCA